MAPDALSAITPAHISGLVVGEGCFYAESAPDSKYRLGWRIRPAFCIEMRHDDRAVLEEVRRQLSCGQIYELDFGRYRAYRSRGWQPHVKYRVTRLSDLQEKVVPFFRRYPLFGQKALAFTLFASLVESLARGDHRCETRLETTKGLAAALSRHNARGSRSRPS